MQEVQKFTREQWKSLIAEAEKHPGSVRQYCTEKGISVDSLYQWRRKMRRKPQASGRVEKLVTKPSEKLAVNSFAKVEVLNPKSKMVEARWVAEFLHYFLGGGR